tara:strand:+ start:266 stop:532 length:267 start_codon:yes stop_codon:yes gene_type:complete
MKYLQKLTKGQVIYQVELHNDKIINIHEKEVISCGKKILKLRGKWDNDNFRINQTEGVFCEIGYFKNPIKQFHLTMSEAKKQKDEYNN